MITPDRQASFWRMRPQNIVWPGRLSGLSVAVFNGCESDHLTLSAPADPDTHVLTVSMTRHIVSMELDGRVVNDGCSRPGLAMLVRAGQRPTACVSGNWQVMQYYLPDRLIRQVAVDLNLPEHFVDDLKGPEFTSDLDLFGLTTSLMGRLDDGDPPSRLELDEIGLMLVEHLFDRYGPKWHAHGLGATPLVLERMLDEYLASSGEPTLDEFANECGHSLAEVLLAVRRRSRGPH